jgi:hypothetical protein
MQNYTIPRPLYGEAILTGENNLLSFAYSVIRYRNPSRRRETAWGAEGLRGNVANENKIMVLASAQARKWQSARRFAQEAMTVGAEKQWSVFSGQ